MAGYGATIRPMRWRRLMPFERKLVQAFALMIGAGILGGIGAIFVILLYGRLIPTGSLIQLASAAGLALMLIVLQGLARARAGTLADQASLKLVAGVERQSEAHRNACAPLVRALRSRSFGAAADLGWVPIFMMIILILHPLFSLGLVAAMIIVIRIGESAEPASLKPDALFRSRERKRRVSVSTLRDATQILLLTLGGALAIRGQVQIGEIVAATLLSLKALGAVSAALDDAPALRAGFHSWQALRRREATG